MFDPDDPHISDKSFKSFDQFDFYKDSEEAIPYDMPEDRGLPMSTSVF